MTYWRKAGFLSVFLLGSLGTAPQVHADIADSLDRGLKVADSVAAGTKAAFAKSDRILEEIRILKIRMRKNPG